MRGLVRQSDRGFTLVELVLWSAVAGLVCLMGLRQLGHQLNRLATRSAVAEAAAVIAQARDEAIAQRAPVSLRIDSAAVSLELRARGDRLALHRLDAVAGLTIAATRDSITFDVRGLGYGAANLTLIARKGAAADTLTVSRLGRVRY